MLETTYPVLLAVPPGLIMSTSPGALHDLPSLRASPYNCFNSGVRCLFLGNVIRPKMHGCQRSVPQRRKTQPAFQRVGRTFCSTKPIHPLDVLGLSPTQDAAEPSVFLNGEELLRSCRRRPASRSPHDTGGHRGVERLDTLFLRNFWAHQHGRSSLNIFRPWLRRPLISLSVEPDP